MEAEQEPKIAVSVAMKVNLGNYESLDGSVVVSGLHQDATAADIKQLLETGELAFDILRARLEEKLNAVRTEKLAGRSNGAIRRGQ